MLPSHAKLKEKGFGVFLPKRRPSIRDFWRFHYAKTNSPKKRLLPFWSFTSKEQPRSDKQKISHQFITLLKSGEIKKIIELVENLQDPNLADTVFNLIRKTLYLDLWLAFLNNPTMINNLKPEAIRIYLDLNDCILKGKTISYEHNINSLLYTLILNDDIFKLFPKNTWAMYIVRDPIFQSIMFKKTWILYKFDAYSVKKIFLALNQDPRVLKIVFDAYQKANMHTWANSCFYELILWEHQQEKYNIIFTLLQRNLLWNFDQRYLLDLFKRIPAAECLWLHNAIHSFKHGSLTAKNLDLIHEISYKLFEQSDYFRYKIIEDPMLIKLIDFAKLETEIYCNKKFALTVFSSKPLLRFFNISTHAALNIPVFSASDYLCVANILISDREYYEAGMAYKARAFNMSLVGTDTLCFYKNYLEASRLGDRDNNDEITSCGLLLSTKT